MAGARKDLKKGGETPANTRFAGVLWACCAAYSVSARCQHKSGQEPPSAVLACPEIRRNKKRTGGQSGLHDLRKLY